MLDLEESNLRLSTREPKGTRNTCRPFDCKSDVSSGHITRLAWVAAQVWQGMSISLKVRQGQHTLTSQEGIYQLLTTMPIRIFSNRRWWSKAGEKVHPKADPFAEHLYASAIELLRLSLATHDAWKELPRKFWQTHKISIRTNGEDRKLV